MQQAPPLEEANVQKRMTTINLKQTHSQLETIDKGSRSKNTTYTFGPLWPWYLPTNGYNKMKHYTCFFNGGIY